MDLPFSWDKVVEIEVLRMRVQLEKQELSSFEMRNSLVSRRGSGITILCSEEYDKYYVF